jgi:hypothetical protein
MLGSATSTVLKTPGYCKKKIAVIIFLARTSQPIFSTGGFRKSVRVKEVILPSCDPGPKPRRPNSN